MKRVLSIVLAVTCVLSASLAVMPALAKISNKPKDKLSYAMGVQTAQALKAHQIQLNPKAFAEGMSDMMAGKSYQMTQKEMNLTLSMFRKVTLAKQKAKFQHIAAQNAQAGAHFLATNQHQSGVKTTASGLQYKVLKKGHGLSPKLNDTVTVNYQGRLINGKVFDSSYKRGKPITFPLHNVIQGWQEALAMMKPGATWMLYIPAKLAYGKRGAPGAIGPNETLVFKVNLVSVTHSA